MATAETNSYERTTSGHSSRTAGQGVVGRVRERAAAQLSTQKDKALDGLGSVAQTVKHSTQQLREQQHETLAGYVERAAEQVDRFAQQLRDKDVGELFAQAQRLARRQPAMFIAAAFALGLIGARFLKSSGSDGEVDERAYRTMPESGRKGRSSTSAQPPDLPTTSGYSYGSTAAMSTPGASPGTSTAGTSGATTRTTGEGGSSGATGASGRRSPEGERS